MLYRLADHSPVVSTSSWIAPSAEVIGQVILHDKTSIWFQSVLRGDTDLIEIGEGSNVQDRCVLHTDSGIVLSIGRQVTIGHSVTLHGCTIGDNSLIGIGSTLLNRSTIGRNCLVGAGSLVTEGKQFPEGSLIMGSPAKVVRPLSAEEILRISQSAIHYQRNAAKYAAQILPIHP